MKISDRKDNVDCMQLGQIRVIDGHLKANYEAMVDAIEACDEDVIVFPQYALTGLYVGDRFNSPSFIEDILYYNDLLRLYSDSKTIVFGSVIGSVGDLSPVILSFTDGEVHQAPIYKSKLNDFESIYFVSKVSESQLKLGTQEWQVAFDFENANDNTIVFGHDFFDKDQPVSNQAGVYINRYGLSNLQDHVYVYTGGSYCKTSPHSLETQSSVEKLFEAVSLAIQLFDEEILPFQPKWLVGVSGGLDSSLTVALLTLALGKDRVVGVNMPSEYSSSTTKGNAKHLADTLAYESLIIPIESMTQGTQSAFENAGLGSVDGLAYENVQARLRGHTLMTLSSIMNGVVCNNGNKIETALGYATLYGDAIGVLGLLADLNKLEVGSLARYINNKYDKEIIPNNLIPTVDENAITWDFAPSAELKEAQVDPMKWGYHDHLVEYLLSHPLEELLESYLDGSILNTDHGRYLESYGLLDPKLFLEDLEWLTGTMNTAKYKRIQSPPMLTLSKTSFYNETQGRIRKTYQAEQLIKKIMSK